MKRKIELIIPLEYWAGESDWRLDHVGPDTVALTNAKGMRWILMIIGSYHAIYAAGLIGGKICRREEP